jgi:hypothetical protein
MKYLLLCCLYLSTFPCFSQADQEFLIADSFYQGGANNCASVALIKAAMLKYGYNNMFTSAKAGSSYAIRLKDGTQLSISEAEVALAKDYASFAIRNNSGLGSEQQEVLNYAYMAYAAIAKNIVKNGYWGCVEQGSPHLTNYKDYKGALYFISRTSFCTDYCYRLLGYKSKENKIFDFTDKSTPPPKGVILYSWPHAVAVYDNRLDCHGTWLPLTTNTVCYNDFKWYIELE